MIYVLAYAIFVHIKKGSSLMKRNIYYAATVCCTLALLCVGRSSRAQLVSSWNNSVGNESITVDDIGSAAGQFTLSSAATVDYAQVYLGDYEYPHSDISTITARLFTDNANSLGIQIATGTDVTDTVVTAPVSTFTFIPQSLSAGKYWLELTAVYGSRTGFYANTTSLINQGTDGTVNQLAYATGWENASDGWNGYISYGLLFSINGTLNPSSVTPEPGSVALLVGIGIAGLAGTRRRK